MEEIGVNDSPDPVDKSSSFPHGTSTSPYDLSNVHDRLVGYRSTFYPFGHQPMCPLHPRLVETTSRDVVTGVPRVVERGRSVDLSQDVWDVFGAERSISFF